MNLGIRTDFCCKATINHNILFFQPEQCCACCAILVTSINCLRCQVGDPPLLCGKKCLLSYICILVRIEEEDEIWRKGGDLVPSPRWSHIMHQQQESPPAGVAHRPSLLLHHLLLLTWHGNQHRCHCRTESK